MHRLQRAGLTALLVTTLGLSITHAQATVTQTDIQRLQDNVFQASGDVTQLRNRDAARADRLQTELDDLRDEVVYLKVKLRKERSLARSEYTDVRDRIEDLRTRAREDRVAAAPVAPAAPARSTAPVTTARSTNSVEVPAGTEKDLRLSNSLN
jgi:TolA-binding protein